jgi:hypothetical protein
MRLFTARPQIGSQEGPKTPEYDNLTTIEKALQESSRKITARLAETPEKRDSLSDQIEAILQRHMPS